jgi:serine/threonine protein kinase
VLDCGADVLQHVNTDTVCAVHSPTAAEGSFGVVYKGIYLPTQAVVAVKVLELDEDETFDDLVSEIEFLRSCSSQFIVKYYGSYKREKELFVSVRRLIAAL